MDWCGALQVWYLDEERSSHIAGEACGSDNVAALQRGLPAQAEPEVATPDVLVDNQQTTILQFLLYLRSPAERDYL
jgi:hypothetical protein